MISVYYPRLIVRELELMAVDCGVLWRNSGVSKAQLDELPYWPTPVFQLFLSEAIKLSQDPGFGLRFGCRADAFSGGFAGLAAISAPTLKDSLHAYVSFSRLVATAIKLELKLIHRDETAYIRLEVSEVMDMADTRRCQLEVLMLTLQNTVESILGRALTEAVYHFSYPAPAYEQSYHQCLRGACLFGGPVTAVDIPIALTAAPLPAFNHQLWRLAIEQCNKSSDQQSSQTMAVYSMRVLEILRCSGTPLLKSSAVATIMHLSQRTLNRRLAQEGSTFRALHQKTQMELAEQYLQHSRLSVDSISALLGYSDGANFRKAIRRSYQCTPLQLRAR